MSLLLGYLASLVSTFLLAVAIFSAVMSLTVQNTHQKHQYLYKVANKDLASKHRDRPTVARSTNGKSMAMTADAAQSRVLDLTNVQ
jgi:hypothetical protein